MREEAPIGSENYDLRSLLGLLLRLVSSAFSFLHWCLRQHYCPSGRSPLERRKIKLLGKYDLLKPIARLKKVKKLRSGKQNDKTSHVPRPFFRQEKGKSETGAFKGCQKGRREKD